MTRSFFVYGYLMCAVVAIAISLLSLRKPNVIMSLGQLIDLVTHKRATRFGILVFWWWLGMHYLGH